MESRWRGVELFVAALLVLVFATAGGAWGGASDHAALAGHFERSAASPLYDLVAGVFARLPVGEPWFRVGVLNAVLGAALVLGVVRAAQELLPKDPFAGIAGAVLLALAPPFRDAAGFPGPAVMAAAGATWTMVAALAHARSACRARLLAAFAGLLVTIGAAPLLGFSLLVLVGVWFRSDRETLALGIGGIGVSSILLWLGAGGSLPELAPDLTATIANTGRGAAVIVVGIGLVGAAFAAVTTLPRARWLAAAIAIAAAHATLVDHEALPLLALLAIGVAVIPSGIVRAVPNGDQHRHVIAGLTSLPLVGGALLAGPAFGIDDPGASPSRVATELIDALPPGPGVVFATRSPAWSAISYERAIAGSRPDLLLAARSQTTDSNAADTMRGGRIAGADTPAFDRLDLRLALPRGRGFQLLLALPGELKPIQPPARYASETGRQLSVLLAVDRARYEAVQGRLGVAARAAGLTERFGAGDLAVLSTTAPSQPAFFGFLPELDALPPGQWMLDLIGDDLAWSAGLDVPEVSEPRIRALHGRWRALWRGEIKPDDPSIAALGPDAVRATTELVETFSKKNRR